MASHDKLNPAIVEVTNLLATFVGQAISGIHMTLYLVSKINYDDCSTVAMNSRRVMYVQYLNKSWNSLITNSKTDPIVLLFEKIAGLLPQESMTSLFAKLLEVGQALFENPMDPETETNFHEKFPLEARDSEDIKYIGALRTALFSAGIDYAQYLFTVLFETKTDAIQGITYEDLKDLDPSVPLFNVH